MKSHIKLLLAALVGLFLATSAFAQDAAPAVVNPIGLPPDAQNFILALLVKLAATHPWVATAITVLGSMRLWAKPVFSAIHSLIEVTPSKTDDGFWAAGYSFLTENPVGKFLAYLLDWIGSIKLTPPGTSPAPKDPLNP